MKCGHCTYDRNGLRQSKTVNGVTTRHIYDGQNIVMDETGSETQHFFRGTELLFRTVNGKDMEYYLSDVHGDVTKLMNTSGEVTRDYQYDGFGNQLPVEEEAATPDNNPFRYCGEYYDAETGSIYLRARYYDTSTGRFLSEDPIKDGVNWYVYAGNNPVMFVDPSGLIDIILKYAVEKVGGSVSFDESTGTATAYFDGKSKQYNGEIINGRMIVDSAELAEDFNLTEFYILPNEGDIYESADDAAMAFGLVYNRMSCAPNGVEYQAYIYANDNGGFWFDDVAAGVDLGNGFRTVYAPDPDPNKDLEAWAHTHGPYPNPDEPDDMLDLFTGRNEFYDSNGMLIRTIGDGSYSHYLGAGGYVFTPDGHFKYLDYTKWPEHVTTWIPDTDPAVRIITTDFRTK